MAVQEIALNKLVLSPRNMRKTGEVNVSDLVASFRTTGKIRQNLNVLPQMKGKKPTGLYEVVAGGRRFRAAMVLAEAGEVPADWPIPCAVVTPEEVEEVTLTENYARLPVHQADTFAAFAKLAAMGLSERQIADRYNIEEARVVRTLRLAKVSPRLFEMFCRDELNFDQMAALTLTEDHDLQERIAMRDGKPLSAWQIREALTTAEVPANDRRAAFVSLDAYREAGGMVRVDLFSDRYGGGYLTDSGLLERLALAKLEAERPAIEAEGWAWVEVATSFDYSLSNTFARIYPERAPLSAEVQAQVDELTAKLEELTEAADYGDEEAEAISELEGQIAALESSGAESYEPAKLALAGAYIIIDGESAVRIERGLVRPADKRALAALQKAAEADDAERGGDGAAEQAGKAKPDYSAALTANLTSHRTLALRVELAKRPDVALIAAVHSLLLVTHYSRNALNSCTRRPGDSPLILSGRDWQSPDPFKNGEDLAASPAAQALDALHAEHQAKLPESPRELWDHLAQATQAELLGYLAYATADSLVAVQAPGLLPAERAATVSKMATAVGLDMADHWTPSAASYFSKVSKAQILEAITEGASADAAAQLAGLKKGDLAQEAEKRLEGRRWLPALLRTGEAAEAVQGASGADGEGIEDEGEGADFAEAA